MILIKKIWQSKIRLFAEFILTSPFKYRIESRIF